MKLTYLESEDDRDGEGGGVAVYMGPVLGHLLRTHSSGSHPLASGRHGDGAVPRNPDNPWWLGRAAWDVDRGDVLTDGPGGNMAGQGQRK